MAVCTSIRLVEHTQHSGDLLEVNIDDGTSALWFYDQTDAMRFVGEEVIVDYRNDIYNGDIRTFIKTFTLPTVVQTLDRDDSFKLYVDSIDDACNIVFSEFAENDSRMGCVVFCTAQEFKSSEKSVWMELIIRDKTMHTAKLRIFDYENLSAQLAGKYIVAALVRTKFGFQTREAAPLAGECAANPEIALAEQYIKNYFSNDVVAMDYMNKINLLEVLKNHVDYEVGYGLMRMAMELEMASALRNITKDVSVTLLSQIILTSYGYLTRKSALSPVFNNVLIASQFKWPDVKSLTVTLDECVETKTPEYKVWKDIQHSVSTLLEIRKGTTYGR